MSSSSAPYRDPAPSEQWSAEDWLARAEHAATHLARDPRWKVGADKVKHYRRMAEKAASNGQ